MSKFIEYFKSSYEEYAIGMMLQQDFIDMLFNYIKENKETLMSDIPDEMRNMILNENYGLSLEKFDTYKWKKFCKVLTLNPSLDWIQIEKDFNDTWYIWYHRVWKKRGSNQFFHEDYKYYDADEPYDVEDDCEMWVNEISEEFNTLSYKYEEVFCPPEEWLKEQIEIIEKMINGFNEVLNAYKRTLNG